MAANFGEESEATGTKCGDQMKLDSVKTVCRSLSEHDVRYLIVGGIAVASHGYLRATKDVDLVVWLESENVVRCFAALKSAGYKPYQPVLLEDFADPTMRESWREEKGMMVLKMWSDIDPQTVIDIFVYEPFDFKREYSRARIENLGDGIQAMVVALGTLLEMKATAGRPQDLIDIEQLKLLHGL